jgi:hypothetical protein
MTPQLSAPPPIPQDQSEIERLAGVFVSPGSAFADIARRPSRWWVPMIILALVSIALVSAYGRRVGWERIVRQSIERSSNADSMTAAQKQQAVDIGARVAQFAGFGVIISVPLATLVMTAIFIFLVDSMMGAEIGFKRMFALVTYSALPSVIYTLLALLVLFLKSPDDFDLQNPLAAFNAAILVPEGSARWLTAMATSFDVFSFWRMALLAIGINAASPKIRIPKAFAAVLFPWALYVVLKTVWAAAFGG